MTTKMFEDRSLNFRVYLDGVNVPFKKITINENAQLPSRATIAVPPHPILNNLPPKSLVHVFYQESIIKEGGQREPQSGWKMLYEGEVTGIGFSRSSNSRSTQLKTEGIANWLRITNGSQVGLSQMFGSNSKIIKMAGTGASKVSFGSQDLKTTITDKWSQKLLDEDTIAAGMKKVIESVIDENIVLDGAHDRLDLKDRFPLTTGSNQVKKKVYEDLIGLDRVQKMFSKELGRVQNRKPILNFIQVVLSPVFHEMNFNSSMLRGWMPKPMLRFAPPPSCNVLIPKMVNSMNFNHNYLKESTRTFLQRKTGGQEASAYVWPNSIDWERFLNMTTGDFDPDEIDDREDFVLTEEMLKGVNPSYKDYSHAYYEAAAKDSTSDRVYFEHAAEHEHHINKLNSSNFQVSGGFNPEPVPGFTTFLADPSFDVVFGYMGGVSHSIDSQGRARTSYRIQLAQRSLSNPRDLTPPQINPIFASSLNVDGNKNLDNLEGFYSEMINSDVKENSDNRVELPRRDEDLEDAWHNQNKFPKNPVLSRALTLMRDITKENINLDRTFFRRGHLTPRQLFEGFYDAKPVQSGQMPDMWGNLLRDGIGDGDLKSLPKFLKSDDKDVQNELIKRRKTIENYVRFLNQQGGSRSDAGVWPPDMDPSKMNTGQLVDYGEVEDEV